MKIPVGVSIVLLFPEVTKKPPNLNQSRKNPPSSVPQQKQTNPPLHNTTTALYLHNITHNILYLKGKHEAYSEKCDILWIFDATYFPEI